MRCLRSAVPVSPGSAERRRSKRRASVERRGGSGRGSRAVSTPARGAMRRSAATFLLLRRHTPGRQPQGDCISVYSCVMQSGITAKALHSSCLYAFRYTLLWFGRGLIRHHLPKTKEGSLAWFEVSHEAFFCSSVTQLCSPAPWCTCFTATTGPRQSNWTYWCFMITL